ncbi:hypothetical protein BABINDRAFT_159185 [Babjeviella inositovora NRRL Y-12698]|uniref:Trafficking protein particle complex subunit 11 domain-containing protein n=1 Tax=Babjeviella inositovora NRRL Y-12698 TaxID=984486 RepID=A0A1E3QYE9_9ASCO|nr:uncharacterized protein BABINDRAFT_159185 [Babjeviella inositovora NRRL Y-12698]ODQ82641.1 hypothetical protein BABINDRAFT_159185 [Babjeviella inositovora NRRL Y-12698]
MENYAPEYFELPSPLVFVQGLEHGRPASLDSEASDLLSNPILLSPSYTQDMLHRTSPAVTAACGLELVTRISAHARADVFWDNAIIKNRLGTPRACNVRFISTQHYLPTRKSPTGSPLSAFAMQDAHALLTEHWFQKHFALVPSVVVSVYEIDGSVSDPQRYLQQDAELAQEINMLKAQLAGQDIRLVPLMVCAQSSDAPSLDARVASLRRLTQLGTKLFYLPAGTQREIEVLVEVLMTSVRTLALDYYVNLEKRIRKRKLNKHGHELNTVGSALPPSSLDTTPTYVSALHLEARQLVKLAVVSQFRLASHDATLKLLEQAHKLLVQVLSNADEFAHASPITPDTWQNYRALLDVIAFHATRLYLACEFPNVAYTKFDHHIQVVISHLLKPRGIRPASAPVLYWLSAQFEWLADLTSRCPSIVSRNHALCPDSVGGVGVLSMLHPGFSAMKSLSLLKRMGTDAAKGPPGPSDGYLSEYTQDIDSQTRELALLDKAERCFQTESAKANQFTRTLSTIYFQKAEIYYGLQQYELAVEWFTRCLDDEFSHWSYLASTVYWRLLSAWGALGQVDEMVSVYLKLCCLPARIHEQIDLLFTRFLESREVAVTTNPVDIQCLFENRVTPLSKASSVQLRLASLVKQSAVSPQNFVLQEVVVEFDRGFKNVRLKHDGSKPVEGLVTLQETDFQENDGVLEAAVNLDLSAAKIFQFTQHCSMIGTFSVKSVAYKASFSLGANATVVSLSGSSVFQQGFQDRYAWHGSNTRYISTSRPWTTDIEPRRPETIVTVSEPPHAIKGEKLKLTVLVDNKDHASVNVDLIVDDTAHSNGTKAPVPVQWADSSGSTVVDVGPKTAQALVLSVAVPMDWDNNVIRVKIKTIFYVENDRDIPVVDYLSFSIPVIDPFKYLLLIQPRLRDGDMPSPMVIPEDIADSIPLVQRSWSARVSVGYTQKDKVALGPLKIVGYELVTTTDLSEHTVGAIASEDSPITLEPETSAGLERLFYTRPTGAKSARNLALACHMKIQWQREGGEVNELVTPSWKLSLPLLDPRILLMVEKSDPRAIGLVYTIENPTARVFTFSTTFSNYELDYNLVVGTDIVQTVLVLPFSHHELRYSIIPKTTAEWFKLPELKVYDVNYKVSLPTLLATTDVRQDRGNNFLVNSSFLE